MAGNSGAITTPVRHKQIEGILPMLKAAELLQSHAMLLVQINELAGVSEEAFRHYYRAAINAFARFVQQLPASEVHHHTGPGGLLSHSLEVCVLALRMRRSYLLSAEGGAEEISKNQDLWTYAIFLAALCHDLAKPVVNQRVELYSESSGEPVRWSPFRGFMDEQGAYYRPVFAQNTAFSPHEKVTPLFVHAIIPKPGMEWLESDPTIFSAWLAALSGDLPNADAIGTIVTQADGQSVSKNLGGGSPFNSTAKPKPLHEKIVTALCQLLASGELSVNGQSAAAWVKDADCWLSSRRTADKIRAQLARELHNDAPTRNSQVFDTLKEHGVIIPCGDKALWEVIITGKDWQNDATVLRVPVSKLWPNRTSRPEDFTGDVHVVGDGVSAENVFDRKDVTLDVIQPAGALDTLLPTNDVDNPKGINAALSLDDAVPSTEPYTYPEEGEDDAVSIADQHLKFCDEIEDEQRHCTDDARGSADDFIAWLQSGIQQRLIPVNESNATVHVVAEGVLLATPAIFQRYADARTLPDWKPVQKTVLKKNWHVKAEKGLIIFKYQVIGKRKSSTVNGILFQDPAFIFGTALLPKPNPHLNLINQDV